MEKKEKDTKELKTGLDLLREPFPARQISKLPKPTKAQNEAVKNDYKKGIRCTICGGWHHPEVIHLDYVGHAALTDRLLDCDPLWHWEPFAVGQDGLPALDKNGGLWINLTVCGMTRCGYGHPDGKQGGDAIKEAIGDALRNAAMRFGAALDLWHKGDLHGDNDTDAKTHEVAAKTEPKAVEKSPLMIRADEINSALKNSASVKNIDIVWNANAKDLEAIKAESEKAYKSLDKNYLLMRDRLLKEEMAKDDIPDFSQNIMAG